MFLKKICNCPQLNFGVLFCSTLSTHFITLCTQSKLIHNLKCMCSYFSQDIRPDQINHTFLRIPLVIVTIVPFLNNLDLSWCSVKMAHCGGFVRKPRKRLESTQCSCTTACCGDGVSLLLYPKPSLKIRTANAIFWIYFGIFRDQGFKNICFGNKTFFQDRKLKLSAST